MKYYKHICLLIACILVLNGVKAQIIKEEITINEGAALVGTNSYEYTAREGITLSANFSYKPIAGKSFTAKIDDGLVFPLNPTTTPVVGIGRDFTSNEVGSLPGSVRVGQNGEANYSIPINVAPGKNGMQPSLVIGYNSNAGNGNLGFGWSLSASGAITRGTTSYLQEGFIDGGDMSTKDKFYLNGSRLILTQGTYGEVDSEYASESESFNKIKLKSTGFEVWNKNGTILYYGNTSNSKVTHTLGTLSWHLAKVSDYDGNIINYNYVNDDNGFRLNNITYAGNEVKLLYSERSDKGTYYKLNQKYDNNTILRAVKVKGQGQLLWTYEFDYFFEQHSHLNEITFKASDNKQFNSTVIEWNSENNFNSHDAFTSDYDDLKFGDFNGDGRDDFVEITSTGVSVYLADPESSTLYTFLKKLSTEKCEIMIVDYDGDFNDDIFLYVHSGIKTYNYYYYGFSTTGFGIKHFDTWVGQANHKLYSADLNGDKLQEVIVVSDTDGVVNIDDISINNLPTTCTAPRVLFADLNSDGKSEMVFIDDVLKVYTYHPSTSLFEEILTDDNYDSESNFEFADFNGDGYLDFLNHNYHEENGINHSIKLYTGTALVPDTCPFQDRNGDLVDWQTYFTGDFNGDGLSDILDVYSRNIPGDAGAYMYRITPTVYIHYSTGDGYTTENISSEYASVSADHKSEPFPIGFGYYQFNVFDANGDGKTDIMSVFTIEKTNKIRNLLLSDKQQPALTVNAITNGMNIRTEITYDYLNEGNCYSQTESNTGLLNYAPKKLRAVTNLKSSFEENSLGETTYEYKDAVFNSYFGFVGFGKFISRNTLQNTYTEHELSFNNTYAIPELAKIISKQGSLVTSTTLNTNHFVQFQKREGFTYLLAPATSATTNALTDVITTTTINKSDYDAYYNPKLVSTTYGNALTKAINSTYYNLNNANYYILGRPLTVEESYNHTDDGIQSVSTLYNYTNQRLNYVTNFSNSGTLARKTAFDYGGDEFLDKKTITSGTETRIENYTWDGTQRFITSVENRLGHKNINSFNTATGTLASSTDANGKVSSFDYNSFGQAIKTTNAEGIVSETTTEWSSSVTGSEYRTVATTTGMPSSTIYYNILGQELESHTINNIGEPLKVKITYNKEHRVETKSLPYSTPAPLHSNSYTYDQYGRLDIHTLANGTGVIDYNYSGLTTSVTSPEGSTVTNYDDAGYILNTTTNGKKVDYKYYSHGLVHTAEASGGKITYVYNKQGKLISTSDPDAGTHISTYDGLGQLKSTLDPKENGYSYSYDEIGRMEERTGEQKTTWYYDPTGNIGALEKIQVNDIDAETYLYDANGRLDKSTQITKHNGSTKTFTFDYNYDAWGQLQNIVYPNGYALDYNYSNGFLSDVSDNKGQFSWSNPTYNDLGMTSTFELGNGLDGDFTYDAHFMPKKRDYGVSIKREYTFNAKGNLEKRMDHGNGFDETFTYDDQNRLKTSDIDLSDIGTSVSYYGNSNIETKSDVGDYAYSGTQPHALSTLNTTGTSYIPKQQTTNFNAFNKISNLNTVIGGTNLIAEFTYGPNQNRSVMKVTGSATGDYTKFYAGKLYEEKLVGSTTTKYNYIYVQGKLMGMYVDEEGSTNDLAYYVHTDLLGSVVALSKQDGTIAQEYAYDAWGKRRNPNDWELADTRTSLLIDRGFTGHEHLNEFELINMNGRVYDQAVGMFLSPDPVLQSPGNALNYNRYSYCWNNPFKYTDPSGYTNSSSSSTVPELWRGDRGDSWSAALGEGGGGMPTIGRNGIWNYGALNVAWGSYFGESVGSKKYNLMTDANYYGGITYGTSWLGHGRARTFHGFYVIKDNSNGASASNEGDGDMFTENPNDPFIDFELNLKLGLAAGAKVNIGGAGFDAKLNLITVDYLTFNASSNSKDIKITPYRSVNSSLSFGTMGLYGGLKQDWYRMSTTSSGQIGLFSKESGKSTRISLIDAGYMLGVGFDLKVTLSPGKFLNGYIQYQSDWNDKVGWSIHSMSH